MMRFKFLQTPREVVRMFHLAVCQALPVGEMSSIITDQMRYASTIDTITIRSYEDCLQMDTTIRFW